MPTSILSTPQLIQPVYNPIYVRVSSDKTAEQAFMFVFDLYVNGNFVHRDRLPIIPATNECEYSPAGILESYLSYDLTHNLTGTTASTNCVDYYEIITGEEYINPWRFASNGLVGSGSTYSGYTTFYTTGTTANPYVAGDTIYVVQDSGFTSNYYNGVFTVLSANTVQVIVDAIHKYNTPDNGGLIYYSDRRKTIYTGATEMLNNSSLFYANGQWSNYGPDGCNVTAGLSVANKLQLSVPDASCMTGREFVFNSAVFTPGVEYQVTYNVDTVNNPSGEPQSAQAYIGGTAGVVFVGTGTSTETIVCGPSTLFGIYLDMEQADTGGFGAHSMSINQVSVTNINGISGYSWNGVIQYEEVPSWTYSQYNMVSGNTGQFLTNQPSTVKTRLYDRGSIGWMNMAPVSGAAYSIFCIITRFDGSPTFPLPIPIAEMTGTTSTNEHIIEFGAYPWNLNKISQALYGVDAVDSGTQSYQLVILMQPDPIGDPDTYVQVSETLTFEIDTKCSKFEPVRFMFLNPLGQFDYFNATLVSKETRNITRNIFQKTLPSNYQVGNRGRVVMSLDVQQNYTVVSDWLSEADCLWLMDLFDSNEVYTLNDDGSIIPIIIDNASVEPFKSANQKMKNYTFSYSKAVTVNTQRN